MAVQQELRALRSAILGVEPCCPVSRNRMGGRVGRGRAGQGRAARRSSVAVVVSGAAEPHILDHKASFLFFCDHQTKPTNFHVGLF